MSHADHHIIDEISEHGIVMNDGTSFTFEEIVEIMNQLRDNYCSRDAVSMPRALQRILDPMCPPIE